MEDHILRGSDASTRHEKLGERERKRDRVLIRAVLDMTMLLMTRFGGSRVGVNPKGRV